MASLQTAIPLLKERIKGSHINSVAFPDDGAAKRFLAMFLQDRDNNMEIIVCAKSGGGKSGDSDERKAVLQDRNATGRHIVIIDDLVQTGGTLYETCQVLKKAGASSVHVFVTHAVFPNSSWKRFNVGGDQVCFDKFWVTNSIPTVTKELPIQDGIFEVLDLMDLMDLMIHDLDHF
jgi:phosphoribosylpyrophosphate synthetase